MFNNNNMFRPQMNQNQSGYNNGGQVGDNPFGKPNWGATYGIMPQAPAPVLQPLAPRQLGQSPFGQQTFDNIPNPFVANSPNNPFFNPDQALNPDIYGGVYGQPNNTFNSFSPENMAYMQEFFGQVANTGEFQMAPRNNPYQGVKQGAPMPQPMPTKQPPVTMNQPAVDKLPLRNQSPMEMLIKMLMLNSGNMQF